VGRLKPISPEDQVSLVDHLGELRERLVVSLAAFGVAFAICFWQSDLLLELANGPLPAGHERLITFGVTEPFTTTLTVSAYGALILALPVVLFQAYAFILPAFSKRQQKAIVPLLLLIPALFIAGIAFGYFVVLPAATSFLLNFNDAQFNIQVRASEYYSFFATTLLACGVVFQVPVGILSVTRLGIVTVDQL
jgi:sec-independent protein translocase protein TatC